MPPVQNMPIGLLNASLPEAQQAPGKRTLWGNLGEGSLPLAIAQAAQKHPGLTLVVTQDTASAEQIIHALNFYLAGRQLAQMRFPDWETLAYERIAPHPEITSERIQTLCWLASSEPGILVVPVTTLMQRLPPHQWINGQHFDFVVGATLNIKAECDRLETVGYSRVDTVLAHGEYAVRGALLDIFQIGAQLPTRIDLFDNEIESLRMFDPHSQRTVERIEKIACLPAREVPLTDSGIRCFKDQWRNTFGSDAQKSSVYKDITQKLATPGIEYYLPLFFQATELLFDYIPDNTWAIMVGSLATKAEEFSAEVKARFENLQHSPNPILPPSELFLPVDELFQHLAELNRVKVFDKPQKSSPGTVNFATRAIPELAFNVRLPHPADRLLSFLKDHKNIKRTLFCAQSPGRKEVILELLKKADMKLKEYASFAEFISSDEQSGITIGDIDTGILLTDPGIAILAEKELFGAHMIQQRQHRKHAINPEEIIRNLVELRPGDAVVHIEHGIGRYQGLKNITTDGHEAEFLILAYAEDATVYVPVSSLHMINRYTGADPEFITLNRLGSNQWTKARKKAIAKAHDMAAELLNIYAARAAKEGFGHKLINIDYKKFAAEFAFEETFDQAKAIQAVEQDMQASRPMDRLICGDVGFGKTEVAMRAAFISVMNGKQVAMLAPTTLLAQQHYQSLQDRFADWPVRIDWLSRFRNAKEMKLVREAMQTGQVDIVVGTHALLQRSVRYKDLGLIIIDEEHRFGVRQKERIKTFRAEADVMTLTATPIPRTLNMAISGLRDLSIIASPPAARLAIKTIVHEHDPDLILEALQRELRRGGQVFYIHNKVQSIQRVAMEISALMPNIKVAFAHGQMHERELEQVIADFYHKRIHILVCTTIIETGIDIPNANTIIVDRADLFGLAQLHQLRGRVGRSHHQAYAYLLIPEVMAKDASKRLQAIQDAGTLGAGFSLATHDMEIRGAGDLLGKDQSGTMETVGFSLYMQMLERAVQAIQSGQSSDTMSLMDEETEVDMHLPALIPEQYLSDIHNRLTLYKRIASAPDEGALTQLRTEIIDRFGVPPKPLATLLRITAVKLLAKPLGVKRIVADATGGQLQFYPSTKIMPETLVALIQSQPNQYELKPDGRLLFTADLKEADQRFSYMQNLLSTLEQSLQAASG